MTVTGIERGVRLVRLASFSVTATVLALVAHVLAGGPPPAWGATVAAVVLPGIAGAALTRRRRRGLIEIAVVLGAVQLVLHHVFSAAGHAGHGIVAGPGRPAGDTPWMPLAHVLAVALTAVLLTRGDRALHLLVEWWQSVPAVVGGLPAPSWVPARRQRVPAVRPVRRMPCYLAAAPVLRRGPPCPDC